MKLSTLLELLQEDTDPENEVVFLVKGVESYQDFARLSDVYWCDGQLFLEFD